jgi:homeobox protein Meis1
MIVLCSYCFDQGYRAKIEEVREEILRKRRAGKLPDGTTTVLKAWWNNHSKWPYPTVPILPPYNLRSC